MNNIQENNKQAPSRIMLWGVLFFLAGVAASAVWFYSSGSREEKNAGVFLSESTKVVLKRLKAPIELRFYSLLTPSAAPAELESFSRRVDELVSAYEREGNGKVQVVRIDSPSDANANAAQSDGIKAFNREKGDVWYLGIAVAQGTRREALAHLTPEWEKALEPDLTRAIERVAFVEQATAQSQPVLDEAAAEAVKRAIPNPGSVSLVEGTRLLQSAALADLQKEVQSTGAKIKEAQEKFIQAQSSQSEQGQQEAMKEIQQLQAEQMEKTKEIAARAKAQIEAFQRLKEGTR